MAQRVIGLAAQRTHKQDGFGTPRDGGISGDFAIRAVLVSRPFLTRYLGEARHVICGSGVKITHPQFHGKAQRFGMQNAAVSRDDTAATGLLCEPLGRHKAAAEEDAEASFHKALSSIGGWGKSSPALALAKSVT